MAENRVSRISALLDSKNRVLRSEAAQQLAQIPIQNDALIPAIRRQLQSATWDTRTAAALALGGLLARVSGDAQKPDEGDSQRYETMAVSKISQLDLFDTLRRYKLLLRLVKRDFISN